MQHQQNGKSIGRRTFLKTLGGAAAFGIANSALPISPMRIRRAQAGQPGDFSGCRIVVFGSDSLRIDYAQTLRQQGAPALNKLNEPIYASCEGRSCTQPGWASIWTGLPSDRIQVWQNKHYKPIPKGRHIFELVSQQYPADELALVWITGKSKNLKSSGKTAPHKRVRRLIKGGSNPGTYAGKGGKENLEVSEIAGPALASAVGHDNFLCFVHFRDPDHMGHYLVNNEMSNDYDGYMNSAFEVDEYIDDLMTLLPVDTNIIYCSDHGFDFVSRGDVDNGHLYSPQGMVATNFPLSDTPFTSQMSIGRLIYRLAGGNPDWLHKPNGQPYRMFGEDLI